MRYPLRRGLDGRLLIFAGAGILLFALVAVRRELDLAVLFVIPAIAMLLWGIDSLILWSNDYLVLDEDKFRLSRGHSKGVMPLLRKGERWWRWYAATVAYEDIHDVRVAPDGWVEAELATGVETVPEARPVIIPAKQPELLANELRERARRAQDHQPGAV
jgi:hypothetical protein